jgi:hypothetical protein
MPGIIDVSSSNQAAQLWRKTLSTNAQIGLKDFDWFRFTAIDCRCKLQGILMG